MKKFKSIVGAMALFAVVCFNVYNAIGVNANTTELHIEDVEYVAEGDGSYLGWFGVLGIVGEIVHQTYFTGREWVYLGLEMDSNSAFYLQKKHRCESAFFGMDECSIAAIAYCHYQLNKPIF